MWTTNLSCFCDQILKLTVTIKWRLLNHPASLSPHPRFPSTYFGSILFRNCHIIFQSRTIQIFTSQILCAMKMLRQEGYAMSYNVNAFKNIHLCIYRQIGIDKLARYFYEMLSFCAQQFKNLSTPAYFSNDWQS